MACVHIFKAADTRMEEGRIRYLDHFGVNAGYPHLFIRELSEEEFNSGVIGAAEHRKTMGKQREL